MSHRVIVSVSTGSGCNLRNLAVKCRQSLTDITTWMDRIIITHAGCIAAVVGRAGRSVASICLFVCLFVRALKGKRIELSTPNIVHIYYIVVGRLRRHALTQRSKGQRSKSHGYENHHGRTVACDACCYGSVMLLPGWVCTSIPLPMFSSYYCCCCCCKCTRIILTLSRRRYKQRHRLAAEVTLFNMIEMSASRLVDALCDLIYRGHKSCL